MTDFEVKVRGRPKDSLRRQKILDSARTLFLEHGLQSVSMDAIAERAGVSNRTVYSHFPTKQDLFTCVLKNAVETLRPKLPEHLPVDRQEFRRFLMEFGFGFVQLLTSPTTIDLGRLMISEAIRHPQMAHEFYRWGPEQTQKMLGDLIEYAQSRKWISTNAPRQCGDHLLSLWLGSWHFRQQLGITKPLTRKQIEKHAEECVDLFLKAYLPDLP